MGYKSKKNKDAERLFSESPFHITNFIRQLDRFGRSIPAFNIKGKAEVKSVFGGFLTIAIIVLTLGYFCLKL